MQPTRQIKRITGRALQARRARVWSRDPHCAMCGKLVSFPDGFELDHKVSLYVGGEDTEVNCQCLCPDCHRTKTNQDIGYKPKPFIGLDGFPIVE